MSASKLFGRMKEIAKKDSEVLADKARAAKVVQNGLADKERWAREHEKAAERLRKNNADFRDRHIGH